jgi:hypothetical protein
MRLLSCLHFDSLGRASSAPAFHEQSSAHALCRLPRFLTSSTVGVARGGAVNRERSIERWAHACFRDAMRKCSGRSASVLLLVRSGRLLGPRSDARSIRKAVALRATTQGD